MTSSTKATIGPIISREQAVRLLDELTALVIDAGRAIQAIDRGGLEVKGKADGSPVTQADLAADRVIAEGLATLCPEIPVVSEERAPACTQIAGSFFLIDPLDGTKEYIAGRDEFTVNLALVVGGTPLLGIIGAPALGVVWRGVTGAGAERLGSSPDGRITARGPIHSRRLPAAGQPWIAAVSRSHGNARTEAFIDARPGAERRALGSAVKFGRIAEGSADIYPRLGPTSEWDIAAGHALLTAAGGVVTDGAGAPIEFGIGRAQFLVPEFIAFGDPAAAPVL